MDPGSAATYSLTKRRRPERLSFTQALRDVGLYARRLLGDQRIEIDDLRIVGLQFVLEAVAAVQMHQGLHAPGIEMVDMLMPQRRGQQRLRQSDQREGRDSANLAAFLPAQRMQGVDQLPVDLHQRR